MKLTVILLAKALHYLCHILQSSSDACRTTSSREIISIILYEILGDDYSSSFDENNGFLDPVLIIFTHVLSNMHYAAVLRFEKTLGNIPSTYCFSCLYSECMPLMAVVCDLTLDRRVPIQLLFQLLFQIPKCGQLYVDTKTYCTVSECVLCGGEQLTAWISTRLIP